MQISYKILKVKDVYEKFLKEVTCSLRKVLKKSVKSIQKVLQARESLENPHQPKTRTMQKPANQPAMQINRLAATKREPKTRGDFTAEQSKINTCNFII